MNELIMKVEAWGEEKGIVDPSNADKQFMKFMEEVFDRGYATKTAAREYAKENKKHFYTEQDLLNVHERYWSIRTKRMDEARLWADKKLWAEGTED